MASIYHIQGSNQASLLAQLIKNLPAVQETPVRSLGWEDPLEKGKATHSSILAWRIPRTCIVHGVTKSRTRLSDFHSLTCCPAFLLLIKTSLVSTHLEF